MNQQINLYQPIFRKQKVVFSALAMAQVLGVVVVVMAGIAAYTAVRLAALEKQLAAAQQYQAATQENLNKLKTQQLELTPSKLLEAEVRRMQAELAERREVARILSGGALANTRGFSAQFEGLARRHVAGSWLTEISIRDGGTWMNLRGMALAPEVVPAYLQAAADAPGRIWFEVGTEEKGSGTPQGNAPGPGARQPVSWRDDDAVLGITRRTN